MSTMKWDFVPSHCYVHINSYNASTSYDIQIYPSEFYRKTKAYKYKSWYCACQFVIETHWTTKQTINQCTHTHKMNENGRITVISLDKLDAPNEIKHSLDDAIKLTSKITISLWKFVKWPSNYCFLIEKCNFVCCRIHQNMDDST